MAHEKDNRVHEPTRDNEDREFVRVPLEWEGLEQTPIVFANQFVAQFNQDEFYLTVGQAAPPPLFGTKEERWQQAQRIEHVGVQPLARFGLTRSRLDELIDVLTEIRDRSEQAFNKSVAKLEVDGNAH